MFTKEMLELARQRRTFVARAGYASFLLYTMFLVWRGHEDDTGLRVMARLAESLFFWVSLFQFFAVQFLLPLFVCGTIARERTTGTLDLLFLTALSDQQIVRGKLASRLAIVILLVLSGLPALSLILLYGGISPWMVVGVEIATLLAILLAGSLSLHAAVVASSPLRALAKSYGILLVVNCVPCVAVCMPIMALGTVLQSQSGSVDPPWSVAILVMVSLTVGAISVVLLDRAAKQLRRLRAASSRQRQQADRYAHLWREPAFEGGDADELLGQVEQRRSRIEWLTRDAEGPTFFGFVRFFAFFVLEVIGLVGAATSGLTDSFIAFGWFCIFLWFAYAAGSSTVLDRQRSFRDLLLATCLDARDILQCAVSPIMRSVRVCLGVLDARAQVASAGFRPTR